MMSLQASRVGDMDQEAERFTSFLSHNQLNLQKTLSCSLDQAINIFQATTDNLIMARERKAELEQKIKDLRSEMGNVHGNKSRAKRDLQEMTQTLEELEVAVKDKAKEQEEMRMKLGVIEKRVVSREQRIKQIELKNQELQDLGERGLGMYQTHLGLTITRTSRASLVFSFTQVSRSDPEKAFLLELTLTGDQYRLVTSEPPLPNMQQIEDQLNATNNLSGCIVYVRKSFQNMAK